MRTIHVMRLKPITGFKVIDVQKPLPCTGSDVAERLEDASTNAGCCDVFGSRRHMASHETQGALAEARSALGWYPQAFQA